jgi:hypothetical protein
MKINWKLPRLKVLLAAAMALFVAPLLAYAAGNWSTLPIVGQPSFCASTVTGVVLPTNQGPFGVSPGSTQGTGVGICGQTVPAGPPALTGAELIPADTVLPNGAPPQTVVVPSNLFASGSIQVVTTNASVTIANGVSSLVSNQATATIAAITLPSAPMNNQVVKIANAGSGVLTITAINANTGQTIVQGAQVGSLAIETTNAAAAAQSDTAYQYQASNTTWYRIH